MEGPTAREVLLPRMIDDDQVSHPYMYARIEELDRDTGRFRQSMLNHFDADFDYGPWKATVENQYTAARVYEISQHNSMGRLFGGAYLTTSPFEARLQRQLQVARSAVQDLPFLEVPWIPQLSANELADLAADNDVVETIRRQIRLATRRASNPSEEAVRLEDLIEDLVSGVDLLDRSIRRSKSLTAVVGAAEIGAVLIGALSLPGIGIAGVAAAAPYLYMRRELRSQPSFMFWQARRRLARRDRRAKLSTRSRKLRQR
jgi:hypothetical protein